MVQGTSWKYSLKPSVRKEPEYREYFETAVTTHLETAGGVVSEPPIEEEPPTAAEESDE